MARNVEIKARVGRLPDIEARAARLADQGPVPIAQDDTFFACPNGRLKLRQFDPGRGELIFYRRDDTPGPKLSFYVRTPTADPDTLRETLALAYGVVGRVRKARTLFLAGRTRIHLDRVDGLGEFLELEVVLEDGEPVQSGVDEAHALLARLGVPDDQLIAGAYIDLLSPPVRTAPD